MNSGSNQRRHINQMNLISKQTETKPVVAELADPAVAGQRRQNAAWRKILAPVASLKLTVVLLTLGVAMTWVASLQQTQADIWQIKKQHFYSPVVFVPIDTFFVPAWTPKLHQLTSTEFLGSKIKIPLPSGATIMVLMMINLLAAHIVRFRVKGRGAELVTGLIVFGLGAILTTMVVINGQNAKGFQAEPIFTWRQLWLVVQIGLGATCLSAIWGALVIDKKRLTERVLLYLTAGILGILVIFLLMKGEAAFIGDSAMRILWQLIQGGVASIVMLVGCHFIFGRKSGIVLLHLGLILLMFGEFYVTYSAIEQRMIMFEGSTVNHTFDIRDFEMAIMSESETEGKEDVITIPGHRLTKLNEIDDKNLPFKINPLEYHRNSKLVRLEQDESSKANTGIGTVYKSVEESINTGTSAKQVADYASMYVELLDKQSKSLGKFLLSQVAYENNDAMLDEVTVDGKTYRIGLRFKHFYKPYSLHLINTERKDYPGTLVPKEFYSEFRVVYPKLKLDVAKKTWMNNPVRFGNETFYQAGHDFDRGREYSVLQIVKNTGWMIPYICCMMVGIGLLAQFGQTFIKFLSREPEQARRAAAMVAANTVGFSFRYDGNNGGGDGADSRVWTWITGGAIVVLLLVISATFIRLSMPKSIEKDGMQLDRFGQIPVTFGGRIQPLESLAKNLVKQSTKRGSIEDRLEVRRKPIRWLADFLYDDENGGSYYFFKVVDRDVKQALGLPRRKGHRYTFDEVQATEKEIRKIIADGDLEVKRRDSPDLLTNFERVILELNDAISLCMQVKYAFDNTIERKTISDLDCVGLARSLDDAANMPLITGPGSTVEDWRTFNSMLTANWLLATAKEKSITSVTDLAEYLVDEHLENYVRPALERRQIVLQLSQSEEMKQVFKQQFPDRDESELGAWIDQQLRKDQSRSNEILQGLRDSVKPMIDALINVEKKDLLPAVNDHVRSILNLESDKLDSGIQFSESIAKLKEMPTHYRKGNRDAFNESIESYLSEVYREPPKKYSSWRLKAESWMNRAGPFYFPMVLYLLAFVISIVGWVGLRRPANRVAFTLIIAALVIHTIGLVIRVYVSGRPPVTSLYSTALFISWGMVIFLMIAERFLKTGIGNLMAGMSGYFILLLSMSLAVEEMDTMSVLRAVLDTQFWLSTHVVIISLGYSSTLAAGVFGMAYIVSGIFSPMMDKQSRKELGRIIYGITCFSLFFSFVGTVLGGLWADDSWGRFWGWDVKENGALMIVLCNAILLHARWAGLVKERGLAVLSLFGNIIVVWSWFAVNELGVGLHAYALTQGKMMWVSLFWLLQIFLIVVGTFWPTRLWISHIVENQEN